MDQLAPSASFRLENQVAVVTGGARGIGAGIVRRFVQEGARVVFSDLLNEEGKGFEEELGKNVAFTGQTLRVRPTVKRWWNSRWNVSAGSIAL